MKIKKTRTILLIAFFYLGFLVITLPAEVAYAFVKKSVAPDAPFMLRGISGSVWSGKANIAVISGQRVNSLSWSIQPWAILLGRMQVQLDFRDGDSFGRGNVARGFGGALYLSDIDARIALEKITALAKLPLGLQGAIGLNLGQLEIENQMITEAEGTIAWQSAAFSFPSQVNLGDLKLTLATQNNQIKADLVDGGGPLQAEGLLTIKQDGKYKFTGTFAARDKTQTTLTQSLRLLGRTGADGKIKVNKSGAITDITSMF